MHDNAASAPTPTTPGILVSPAWVGERLDDPALRLVDLRDAEAHALGHIPGAAQLDLARLGTKDEVRDNILLPPGPFAELMSELGVSDGDTVVAYDDQWGLAAARLVWALHYYGHPAAAVLDGGWDRWTDEGRAVASGPATAGRGSFSAEPAPEVGAELDWLRQRIGGPDPVLVDTRTPAEYGDGHLAGARSWDWFNAVPADSWNAVRDVGELREEWSALGIEPSHEIVVYCRSGMRAAHTWVALKHAGYPRVRLYDGSWQEWSAHGTEDEVE